MKRALELAGAPEELIAWVVELDVLEPWESCQKGDWLLWLVACAQLPLDEIVDAMRLVLEAIVATRRVPQTDEVLGMLRDNQHAGLHDAVARLEQLAEAPAENYRGGTEAASRHAMRAVALLGHAAEALHGITEQVAASRIQEALSHGTAPRPTGQAVLEPELIERDPTQQVLGFVITAAAESAHEAVLAQGGGDATEDVEAEIADSLYELLTEER